MKRRYTRIFPLLVVLLAGFLQAEAQVTAAFSANVPSPACNPAVVSFSNASTGTAPLSYQWNFGVYTGTNSIFQNPSTSYLNCGSFTVTLIVTDSNGATDTATQTISIHCSPTPAFSVNSNSGCAPFDVTYNDASNPGSGTINNITWDFGDGYLGSGNGISHTYTTIGCNTVTQIVTNSFGCTSDTTITAFICVAEPPAVSISSTNPTGCAAPFDVTFNANTTGGASPFTYAWSFGNGDTGTDASPTITFTSPGAFSAAVTVTDANGCTAASSQSNYINVASNSVSIAAALAEGCAPFVFNASANTSSAPQSISWLVTETGQTGSGANASFTFTDPGTYSVCLDVAFSGGCTAQMCTTVTVYEPPVAAFGVLGNDPTCLRPSQLSFTNASTGAGLSYSWSFPGGSPASSSDSVPPSITYVSCGTFSASLVVTDANGCTASAAQPGMFTITCPTADFTADVTGGCVPLTVSFNSESSVGGPVEWEWSFGDSGNGTSNQQNPSFTFAEEGCFTVTLITTTAEGCKDTTTYSDMVCAGTPPVVDFTSNPPVACADETVTFINNSTNVFPYTQYVWDFIGVPPYDQMSTLMNPTYVYNDTGWFDITLIASNYGCADTLTIENMEHILPPVAVPTLSRTCANPLVVTLSGTQSLGADTYSWVIPGGNPSTATTPTVTVTYTSSGNYSAQLYVTNLETGCDHQASINIPVRDVEAEFTGNPLQGCAPLNACMTNQSVDAVSYAWLVTNASTGATVATSTQTNPCFNLTNAGVYNVRLIATDMFGCRDTMNKPSYITVWRPTAGFYGTPLQGCTPLTVNFTDTSFAATSTIVSWSWNFGDPASGASNTSTQQHPTHVYNNPGYYTVSLTVTDNHGCTRTVTQNNYVHAIHPNADFLLSSTNVCPGAMTCFTNASSGTGLTFAWDFGNGLTSTLAAPCMAYNDTGAYSVTLVVTDSYGCTDTTVKTNYVNVTDPYASFVADTTFSSCPPLIVQFQNLSAGAVSYQWQFGNGSVSTAPNPTHIYNQAGTYTVTLIATNADGCRDTLVMSNYITIGGPQASVVAPVTSGCGPLYTCFEAVSSTTISYVWNFGDGTVTTGGDSICYTYDEPGTYYPELILNDGVGCTYALPVGQINVGGALASFIVPNNPLCGAGTLNFIDQSSSSFAIVSRTWNFGDPASGAQNTSTSTNPSHYFASPGDYIVTLMLETADGCTSTIQDTVNINAVPVAAFAANDSSICLPSQTQFTDLSTAAGGIAQWNWSFGDGNTSNDQHPVHEYTTAGFFTVSLSVVDANGCTANASFPVMTAPGLSVVAGPDTSICIGESVQLFVTGAVNYVWSPAEGLSSTNTADPVASPTVTTTYTLQSIASNGCTGIDTLVIMVNGIPQIDQVDSYMEVCGLENAEAWVIASNGEQPYFYFWSNGDTQDYITGINGGTTYGVTVTDVNGCTASGMTFVGEMLPPSITYVAQPDVCGNANGTLQVSVMVGMPPFQFTWDNGATDEFISGLSAGSYGVTVMDGLGCTASAVCVVPGLAPPTVSLYGTDASCGTANGAVNAEPAGSAPFTFAWSDGAATEDIAGLDAGSYSVTVTDNNGCTIAETIAIDALALFTLTETHIDATCESTNGAIDLTVIGGTAPFAFAWNTNLAFTEDLFNISEGTYTVVVTDGSGCTASLGVDIATTLSAHVEFAITGASCGQSNGSVITTVVTGGTSPFVFAWSNGAATQDLANIPAGSYTLTVTDATGCTSVATAAVNNLSGPTANAVSTNATCSNANGSVTLSVTGGVAPHTFSWSSGAATQNLSNVAAGTYVVTVTDANGCVATDDVTVNNIGGPSVSTSVANTTCNASNGGVTLMVAGGTMPYTFAWSNGATTQNLVNQAAGTYSVTVTDANGCTDGASASVGNNPGVSPSLSTSTSNSTCNSPSGSVALTVSGGVGPFTFSWSNGAATQNLSNVTGGTYTVTVTGSNGCTTTTSATVNFTNTLNVSINSGNSQCNNPSGTLNAIVSGTGTSPFTYQWSHSPNNQSHFNGLPPGTYYLTVTDVNGCSTAAQTTVGQSGQQPQAAFTYSGLPCENQGQFTFNRVQSGNFNISATNWYFGNGASASGNNVSYTFPSAGTYTVSLVVYGGVCTDTESVTIVVYPMPQTTGVTTNVNCNVNGSVDISVIGSPAPFTYNWSNGAATQDLSSVPAGTYNVTVTSGAGCTGTGSYTVGSNSAMSVIPTVTHSTCDEPNGAASVAVGGGVAPYTYQWSTGATVNAVSNLAAGAYGVTVTDATNCALPMTITVNSNPAPALSAVVTDAACGQAIGAVNLSLSGGTSPFAFNWSNGATAEDIANVVAGSYAVTVTDANNCTAAHSVAVSDQGGPVVNATSNPTACDQSIGSLGVNVFFGNGPYTYNWSTGHTSANVLNVATGTYNVSVYDVYSCLTVDTVFVDNLPGPGISFNQLNTTCGNANGEIDITVTSGTMPYTYNWNSGAFNSPDLSGISAGTYSLVVTDANNCQATQTVVITDTPGPSAVSFDVFNADCGQSNGLVEPLVTGGTAPFTYNWSNGSNNGSLGNVAAGNYGVTVMDANGCTVNGSATVGDNPAQTVSVMHGTATCGLANGSVDATVAGGAAPFAYDWNNGQFATEDIANIAPGAYTIVVTDTRGCTATANALVDSITPPLVTYVVAHTTCSLDNGLVDATPSNGTAPYTYNWNNGMFASQDISNLAVGAYTLVMTDANGCTASISAQVDAISVPTIQFDVTPATCGYDNGIATVIVTGSTGPFSFEWNDPNASTDDFADNLFGNIAYATTVTDTNNCVVTGAVFVPDIAGPSATATSASNVCPESSNGSIDLTVIGGTSPFGFNWNGGQYTTEDIANLAAGTYAVVITDANNCQFILVQSVDSFATPVVAFTATDPTCSEANGLVIANASNGTSPYLFDWSNGDSDDNLLNIPAGNYSVTVTDANGCTVENNIILNTTPAVTADIASTSASCNQADGNVMLTVNTGSLPYTFTWSNGVTAEDLFNVATGTYVVTVTDSAFCAVTVSILVDNSDGPTATHIATDATCGYANGAVDVSLSGGSMPYQFLWSNGATTQDVTSVGESTYGFTVTDATGCEAVLSIPVANIPGPVANYNITSSTCGYANGAADVTLNGGTAPFVFQWSNAATTEDIDGVPAGMYGMTVTDANACQDVIAFPIANIAGPTVSLSPVSATCSDNNGQVNLTATGGTLPYTFSWSNGATTEDIANIFAGPYSVTLADANNCIAADTTIVGNSGAATVTLAATTTTCGFANGLVESTLSGGTAPFYFSWSNGSTAQDIGGLMAGTYTLSVTDANGCLTVANATVDSSTSPMVQLTSLPEICSNANGSVNLTATLGTTPYTFAWSNGATTEDLSGLAQGTYAVTVTDIVGCTAGASAQVGFVFAPELTVSIIDATCEHATGFVNLDVSGSSTAFIFLWSNGATTQHLENVVAGSYTVTVTDSLGCQSTANALVNTTLRPEISYTVVQPSCGEDNGAIDVSSTNGQPGYAYNWSNGATAISQSNLTNGIYVITVTDQNNCQDTATVNLNPSNGPVLIANALPDTVCYGESIQLSATGGVFYTWSPTANLNQSTGSSVIATPPVSTTYTVTAFDSNNCPATQQVVVTVHQLPVIPTVAPQTICYGQSASLLVNGILSYTWSGNGIDPTDGAAITVSPLASTTYTIAAIDQWGCIDSINTHVTVNPLPVMSTSISDPTLCIGEQANLSVSGASSYQWTPVTALTFLNNATTVAAPTVPTTYTVYGTSDFGCVDTVYFDVMVFALPDISVNPPNPVICELSSTVMTASGADQYYWSPSLGLNTTTGFQVTASPGAETTYTVIGSSADGCTASATATIYIGDNLTLSLSPAYPEICVGGSVTLSVLGAEQYQWTPSVTPLDSAYANVIAAPAGTTTYTVIGSDAAMCTGSMTLVVTVHELPEVTANSAEICPNGSATLTANGAQYYQWTPGTYLDQTFATTVTSAPVQSITYTVYGTSQHGCVDTAHAVVAVTNSPGVAIDPVASSSCYNDAPVMLSATPAGGAFSGPGVSGNVFLPAQAGTGTHSIVYAYQNALGCFGYDTITITVNTNPVVTLSDTAICFGQQVQLAANGADTFEWFTQANIVSASANTVTLEPAATSAVTVIGTNAAGCADTAYATVTVHALPVVDFTMSSYEHCADAQPVTLNGSPLGGAFSGTAVTGNVFNPQQAGPGTYHINYSFTDNNGCTNDTTRNITVNSLPVITVSTNDTAICVNNSVTLQAGGAVSYQWTPATGLSVTNAPTTTATPLNSTAYIVTGTDANGCSAQAQGSIVVHQLPVLSSTHDKVCSGFSGTLTVTGATTYVWSPATGLNANTGPSVTASGTQSTTYTVVGTSAEGCSSTAYSFFTVDPLPVVSMSPMNAQYCINNNAMMLSGLPGGGVFSGPGITGNQFNPALAGVGGPYTVSYNYTDMNGCVNSDTQQVIISALPNVTATSAVMCAGETSVLTASGAAYYTWSNASSLSTSTGSQVTSFATNPTQYVVTGTDNSGCSATATSTMTVNPVPNVMVNNNAFTACQGTSVTMTATGANAYQWFPNVGLNTTVSNQVIATPSFSLIYTIVGTNNFGCADTAYIPFTVLELPVAAAGPDAQMCEGSPVQLNAYSDGSVTWMPSLFLSNPAVLNPVASPNSTMTYTLVATAANGCTASDQVVVTVVNNANLNITGGGLVCVGSSASLQATGGVDYTWMPQDYLNATQGAIVLTTPLTNITYTVTANASLGCPVTDTVVIEVKEPIYIEAGPGARICYGESYQLSSWGTGLTYQWAPANSLDNPYVPFPVASPHVTTTYTVTTTDNVCFTETATVVLVVNPQPQLTIAQTQVNVVAGSGQQLSVTGSGSFQWSPPVGLSCTDCPSPFANPTQPTTYTVTVTDTAGCLRIGTVELDFLCDEDGIYIPNAFTPNGDGKNDVFRIRGYGVKEIKVFRVFSRWGELMFETTNAEEGWDGTFKGQLQSPAVYVYYVEGVCTNDQLIVKKGNVTLIR